MYSQTYCMNKGGTIPVFLHTPDSLNEPGFCKISSEFPHRSEEFGLRTNKPLGAFSYGFPRVRDSRIVNAMIRQSSAENRNKT